MQMLIVHSDLRAVTPFEEKRYFYIHAQPNMHLISQLEIDVLVVYEEAVTLNTFLEKRSFLQETKIQFFVMQAEDEETEHICRANGVIPILYHSNEQVADEVTQIVYPENPKSNRLFLFMGAEHRTGLTSIVHSVAEQLSTHLLKKKVLVLSLSDKPNDDFVEFSKSSVDTLKTTISSKVVTFLEIFRESEAMRKYQFLAGPRDMVNIRHYKVEDITHFLEVLRNQEDYIVLIDGGANLDNPLTIAALWRVSNKFMVLNNSKSNYKRLDAKIKQVLSPAFGYNYSSFLYIFNQFDEDVESIAEIEARKSICVEKFPISSYGSQSEEQEIPLSILDSGVQEKALKVARLIATKADCEFVEAHEKKSKLKKLFQTFKGGEKLSGVST